MDRDLLLTLKGSTNSQLSHPVNQAINYSEPLGDTETTPKQLHYLLNTDS
jgi:hypothetical protein